MQVVTLHKKIDHLHKKHGDPSLCAVYGAGCTKHPRTMFIFMNPTARNVSAQRTWKGLRAPWLGTKNVWKIFFTVGVLSKSSYEKIQALKPNEWNERFCDELYSELKQNRVFITNLAKCTQRDARPLKDGVFQEYRDLMLEEIAILHPQQIISFGNQVSSILLGKQISIGDYTQTKGEPLIASGHTFTVYPTHYPVGQGTRNMPIAIQRIRAVRALTK